MANLVLNVDMLGHPIGWMTAADACVKYVCNEVLWEIGPPVAQFHSGLNRDTGNALVIEPACIIGVRGQGLGRIPENSLRLRKSSRKMLFMRDRHICAYCGLVFDERALSKDHIQPVSRGGEDYWMNVVTACKPCNQKKADHYPHEVGMELLYAPYVPSRIEALILRNKRILTDQMEFLLERVPKHSRLKLS